MGLTVRPETATKLQRIIADQLNLTGGDTTRGRHDTRQVGVVRCGPVRDETHNLHEGNVRILDAETLTWEEYGDCYLWANGASLFEGVSYIALRFGEHTVDGGSAGSGDDDTRPVFVTLVEAAFDSGSSSGGPPPGFCEEEVVTNVSCVEGSLVVEKETIWVLCQD